ncbi:MAG: glycosyl hydrolase [Puia sp.]
METEYVDRYPGDDLIDIMGFDIYQANILRDNMAFINLFSKDLSLLDQRGFFPS